VYGIRPLYIWEDSQRRSVDSSGDELVLSKTHISQVSFLNDRMRPA
jgi:hypothetical protein